jgi:hypothetical protein
MIRTRIVTALIVGMTVPLLLRSENKALRGSIA